MLFGIVLVPYAIVLSMFAFDSPKPRPEMIMVSVLTLCFPLAIISKGYAYLVGCAP